jgi:hypothetical protein
MGFIGRAVAPSPISANDVPDLPASKITSGTFAESFLTNATTDLQPLKSDITALALREATNESSASFNLPNQHIDTFATDTLGTKTNASINSGYVSSVSTGYASPSTTADDVLVLDSFGHSDNEDNFVDLSSGGVGLTTLGHSNSIYYDDNQKLTGASVSIRSEGGSSDELYNANANTPSSTAFQNLPSETNYTVELWVYPFNSVNYGTNQDSLFDIGQTFQMEFDSSQNLNIYNAYASGNQGMGTLNKDAWNHVAYVKQGSTAYVYKNGVSAGSGTARTSNFSDNYIRMMYHRSSGTRNFDGFIDLVRVTKRAVYPDGTTFVPANVWNYETTTVNTTGTIIQNTNTVGSSKSEVGGTFLYKNESGTATLGTDLKVYFTCNGGTNWTEATSYNAITPVYSTGISQVRLGKTTCTAGTDVRYKVEWANQSGSKTTQLHGIGINY